MRDVVALFFKPGVIGVGGPTAHIALGAGARALALVMAGVNSAWLVAGGALIGLAPR